MDAEGPPCGSTITQLSRGAIDEIDAISSASSAVSKMVRAGSEVTINKPAAQARA